jgi:hypothetical protein
MRSYVCGPTTRKRGRALPVAIDSAVLGVLTNPFAAGFLGLVSGAGLLLLTKRASRLVTPDDPTIGMAKALAVIFCGLAGAVAALTLLHLFARAAVLPFGAAISAGFLLAATIELFKFGGFAAVSGRRR